MRVKENAEYEALGLAELLRHGEVTAGEVYAGAVEAITVVNAKINAAANGPWERPREDASTGPSAASRSW
jgi:amidase